jgi:hypothetical protein
MTSAYHGDISAYLWREKMFLGGSFAILVVENSKRRLFKQPLLAGHSFGLGISDSRVTDQSL